MTNSRGFTLLEMLLALTIFAIVMNAAWGAFSHLLGKTTGNHQQLLESHALSNLYLQLGKDLEGIEREVIQEVSNAKGLPRTRPALRLNKKANDPCATTLEIETRSYLFPYQSIKDQAIRVRYRLEKDGNSRRSIKRSVSQINQEREAAPFSPTIMPSILCWNLAVRDGQGRSYHSWPPAMRPDHRPRAVQLQVDIQTAQYRGKGPVRMSLPIGDGIFNESRVTP